MTKEINVNIHQLIGFNPLLVGVNKESMDIFMPGCSLLGFGKENVEVLYKILKKEIPEIALATYCCGKPSKYIYGGKKYKKRVDIIRKEFHKTIYTACPNCFITLKEENVSVISIWPIIEKAYAQFHEKWKGVEVSLHDPCTATNRPEDHQAIRNILNQAGISVVEMKHNREKALCCGKKNMTMALNPERGKKILAYRLKELKTPNIMSYCASCTESFSIQGVNSFHISHIFIEKKTSYTSIGRLKSLFYFKKA